MKKLVFWALSPVWMPLSILTSVVAICSTLLLDQLDLFYDWAHQPTSHGAINSAAESVRANRPMPSNHLTSHRVAKHPGNSGLAIEFDAG